MSNITTFSSNNYRIRHVRDLESTNNVNYEQLPTVRLGRDYIHMCTGSLIPLVASREVGKSKQFQLSTVEVSLITQYLKVKINM